MQQATRILAILFALLAVLLAVIAFALHRRPPSAALPPPAASPHVAAAPAAGVPVVYAKQRLPADQPIDPALLAVKLSSHAPIGSYHAIKELDQSVPLIDLPAGSIPRADVIQHGISLALKTGERAIAVPIDELASAGDRIVAGSEVDVFASYRPTSAPGDSMKLPGQDATWNRLLLSRIRVLAVGSHDLPRLEPASATTTTMPGGSGQRLASASPGAGESASQAAARTAVLAIPVELVSRLLLASQNGKLVLALRNPLDSGQPDPDLFPAPTSALAARSRLSPTRRALLATPENTAFAGIDLRAISGAAVLPAPPMDRPRPAASGIEVIRGSLPPSRSPAQ